jgi:hypothetical protein
MRRTFCALTVLLMVFPCVSFLTGKADAEPNLIGWWKFDEGTGTIANDSSGNNYNGTINGATWFNDPFRGWCLSFDGINDYVSVTDWAPFNITGDITISAWIYMTVGSSTRAIVTKCGGTGATSTPFDFRTNGTNLALVRAGSDGNDSTYSVISITTEQWHHVVVRVENKVPDFYLDGAIIGKTVTFFTRTPTGNNIPLYIGRRGSSLYFNGKIDEVSIYNRALSAEEIKLIFNKANNPNPANDSFGIKPDTILGWTLGNNIFLHDVYFGTNFNDVENANKTLPPGIYKGTVDVNSYIPGRLQRDTSYCWRIDEISDGNLYKGDVWNFKTSLVWKYDFNFPNDPFTSNVIFESDPRWVKFTIKLDDPCTIYYQDSKLYPFHYDFATNWLEPFIGMTVPDYFNVTLYDANQEASLGAIILPPMMGNPPTPTFNEYGIQFIRYDPYTKEEISSMFNAVKNSVIADPCVTAFYFPTYEQLQVANANKTWFESQGIPIGSLSRWIKGDICYSKGWAIGRLKYFTGDQIQAAYTSGQLLPDDILMTDGVPAEVPYVAGIISLTPSTPNSHVAILSNTYGIPFVYLANASDVNKVWQLVNQLTFICIQETSGVCSVQLKDAMAQYTSDEIAEMLAMKTPGTLDISPMVTYGSYSADANNLLPKDINHFGGKASNYGMLRTSIPGNSPRAAAISFDLWNVFLDQPLTPCASTIIDPCGYVLFWADNQPAQGVRHADFKLSKTGEQIGLADRDGTLIDSITFGAQTQDVSYGRTPDGNNTWAFFSGTNVTPNTSNPGSGVRPTQGLFINEFMAENKTNVTDEFGEHDDWIEIYNAGPAPVDLGGMYLTDDLSNPTKWMIPVGLTGNTLRQEIANRLAGYSYPPSNLAALSVQLAAIRNIITNPNITHFAQQQDSLIAMLQDPNYGFNPNKLIRFRSSTNVEDSDKFSGAGLYDSYSGCLADDLDADTNGPCACDSNETAERGAFRAIRKVLASFYNENAYLERMRHEVNEHNVGMAMLVHHSFPDDIELANGVATMERKSGQSSWDIKLVTQKGAVSVTNPVELNLTPEETSVYADRSGGMAITLMHQSNLVILGETVMQWQNDYNDLVRLLVTAAERFEQVTGKTDYILDFEYKKVGPDGAALPAGGIDVDQIRQIPRIDTASITCPSFDYSCACNGLGANMFSEQSYEDPVTGASIETSYCLSCPTGICIDYELRSWCRTVIRGFTSKPIVLSSSNSQSFSHGHHYGWIDFLFTPSLEPGMDQCLLNQLRAKDIRVIHLYMSAQFQQNYLETFGFGSGPYYLGDIQSDGKVNMRDLAKFAQKWLNSNCGYCGGADFDCDDEVSIEDLEILIDNWLAH